MTGNSEKKEIHLKCKSCNNPFDHVITISRQPVTSSAIEAAPGHPPPLKTTIHVRCPHCTKNLFAHFDVNNPPPEIPTGLEAEDDRECFIGWRKFQAEQKQQFASKINSQATTFNTIFTGIFGIYVAILVFFGLSSKEGVLTTQGLSSSLPLFIPIIFWIGGIACLLYATRPFTDSVVSDSSESFIEALDEGNLKKANWFTLGMGLNAAGTALIIVAVTLALTAAPPGVKSGQDVQFVIGEDGLAPLKEIPVEFEAMNRTVPLYLLSTTSDTYVIRLKNNDTFDIPKTWVKVVIVKAESGTIQATSPEISPSIISTTGVSEQGSLTCSTIQK
jgi:hypothetical protein